MFIYTIDFSHAAGAGGAIGKMLAQHARGPGFDSHSGILFSRLTVPNNGTGRSFKGRGVCGHADRNGANHFQLKFTQRARYDLRMTLSL